MCKVNAEDHDRLQCSDASACMFFNRNSGARFARSSFATRRRQPSTSSSCARVPRETLCIVPRQYADADRTSSVLASCRCIHSFGVVLVSGTLCGVCHTCAYGCCVAFSNFVMDVGQDTPSSPRMKSGASMEQIRKKRKTLKTCCDIR